MLHSGIAGISLRFPELLFLREDSICHESKDKKTAAGSAPLPLYRLDWGSRKDSSKIVSEYCDYAEGVHYLIAPHYYQEIRRCAMQALVEWTMQRKFDTVIRELCSNPAIAYIDTAFRLLSDCAYDIDKRYWHRDNRRVLLPHILMYKFWIGQTGRGMVELHAGFGRLGLSAICYDKQRASGDTETLIDGQIIAKFLKDMTEFEQADMAVHQFKYSVPGLSKSVAVVVAPIVDQLKDARKMRRK